MCAIDPRLHGFDFNPTLSTYTHGETMKKVLVLLGALVAPMVVHAADKPLLLDQDVYERVFLECAKTFNGPQKTTFNDLDEALEVCRDTAKEIAVRQGTLKMAVGSNWEEVQVMEKPGYMVDLNAKLMREEKQKQK